MKTTCMAILVGIVIGCSVGGIQALCLALTRPYRQMRNLAAIGLGYALVGSSTIGSLLLLRRIFIPLGIVSGSNQSYDALFAFAISYACCVLIAIRTEAKWRKSMGMTTERC
jgi:hypothetical protein